MNNRLLLNSNTLFQIPILHYNKSQNSFISIHLPKHKILSFHVKIPSGSLVFSSKTPTKGETSSPGTEEFDFEDEFDEEFEEEDGEDDDEDIIVPLRHMRQWTRNKPLGFGEGKVYDTRMEDKLLEELEQSRVAQLANVNNLKNNPEDGNPNSKKEKLPKQKVPEVVANGIRVRLINLPKKKNIHRDLQAAFKPFSGIINIIPAVTGNEKTREPVCKGSAFVDFKSEKEANRFVNMFSTQPIIFGKVEKQIRCEIMKPSIPKPATVKPLNHKKEKSLPVSDPTVTANSNLVAAFESKNVDDGFVLAIEDETANVVKEKHEGTESVKKVTVKGKKKKMTITGKKSTPKVNIPGSASRLKMKEKALLSGVFSKYGGKPAN